MNGCMCVVRLTSGRRTKKARMPTAATTAPTRIARAASPVEFLTVKYPLRRPRAIQPLDSDCVRAGRAITGLRTRVEVTAKCTLRGSSLVRFACVPTRAVSRAVVAPGDDRLLAGDGEGVPPLVGDAYDSG